MRLELAVIRLGEAVAALLEDAIDRGIDERRYGGLKAELLDLSERADERRCKKNPVGWHVWRVGMDAHNEFCRHCGAPYP